MIIAIACYLMAAHLEMWACWWEVVGDRMAGDHSRLAAAETLTADHADAVLRGRM